MKRRRVLELGVGLVGAALFASTDAAACRPKIERVVSKVGTNHGHVFTVSVDDVKAGVEKTYDLTGGATHGHSVTLEADDFQRIQKGEILRVPSSKDGHLHRLLVKVAPAVDPPEAISVVDATIGGKDDHELVINAGDMSAKAAKTFDIQGIAAHTHEVSLGADDFERLAKGKELSINTTAGDGHSHVVFIRYPKKKASA